MKVHIQGNDVDAAQVDDMINKLCKTGLDVIRVPDSEVVAEMEKIAENVRAMSRKSLMRIVIDCQLSTLDAEYNVVRAIATTCKEDEEKKAKRLAEIQHKADTYLDKAMEIIEPGWGEAHKEQEVKDGSQEEQAALATPLP